MSKHQATTQQQVPAGPSWRPYIWGFELSVLLTVGAFWLVASRPASGLSTGVIVAGLLAFAVAQLAVQVFCFLHLGSEAGPRWRLGAFLFAGLVILIVVLGSLWIMDNLHYNMMPAGEQGKYLHEHEGI